MGVHTRILRQRTYQLLHVPPTSTGGPEGRARDLRPGLPNFRCVSESHRRPPAGHLSSRVRGWTGLGLHLTPSAGSRRQGQTCEQVPQASALWSRVNRFYVCLGAELTSPVPTFLVPHPHCRPLTHAGLGLAWLGRDPELGGLTPDSEGW